DESAPIGMLEPVGPVDEPRNGKQTWRYTFPPQDFDLGRGYVHDPAQKQARPNDSPFKWQVGDGAAADVAAGTVDFRRSLDEPHPRAIVPLDWVRTTELQASLIEIGEWVSSNGIDAEGPFQAARELLLRRPPRAGQAPGDPLGRLGEADLEGARRLALALDRSTLPIQGPPGSGKTYSGARMILTLLDEGKRVGITGTSHKVIGNLLRAVLKAAEDEPGIDVRPVQRGDKDQVLDDERVTRGKDPGDVREQLADGRANLAAGTPWLWASSKMAGAVDVLFVDEAGQISLANVIAVSRATNSLVLLGDPQQLDQPMRGTHPPGADQSALAHVLSGQATMPADRGLFLETTWRLHPELCRFTSEVFYDDRLAPEPHLIVQRVDAPGAALGGSVGPRLLGTPTVGADSESPDEADEIARVARSIVEAGATWVNEKGEQQPVTWEEVLIVAPYNAQVGAIKRRLPTEARVGTVDKFQGQEAPISIYSMTTSSPELAPRGMDFLYSRHRLNVATSRARCITIVAAAPDLLRVRARTPKQMRLANALCRFAEVAIRLDGGGEISSSSRLEPAMLTLGL
ncbi:MAG TPA: ATP-binding protein, partial [Candidatus Limnocylindrales bacterium]|nr:ATP-binding protein [Candidatus Limnocylindrales bacterium]